MANKVCTKCGIKKNIVLFRKKKSKMCRNGYYTAGACIDCENEWNREYTKNKRLNDPMFAQKVRDRIKKYSNTNKGRINAFKRNKKYREKKGDGYIISRKKNYQARLKMLKREISELSDEYIITQLQNPHRKEKYTRQYLKKHPEVIELARARILQYRIKNKLEELGTGFCRRCKIKVPVSEFRKQRATEKRKEYIVRLCKKCQKQVSIENWINYKNKKITL